MNVVQSRASVERSALIKAEEDLQASAEVNFYNDVPNYELTLDEFEEFALARLKVLRKIEELKIRNVSGDAFCAQLDTSLKTQGLTKNPKLDVASHYVLRAAYCRTEELRRWFLTQEGHLFKHRLERAISQNSASFLQGFLKRSNIHLTKVSEKEKERLRPQLLSIQGMSPGEFASSTYFCIPFTEALDLISHRSCFLQNGKAYVPQSKVVSILCAKFRTALSKSLVMASASFEEVAQESVRIAPLLKSMNSQYTSKERYNADSVLQDGHEFTAADVDGQQQSMPLCMSQLHAGLKQDHKLKHWGRLQYGLFLKGAGLSMEESLIFMQREFSKIMTPEAFVKEYSYNIRHMYGKEGKRASYTPYNCMKIILGPAPQAGDHHGCPYRHYDDAHLASLLQKLKVGTAADRAAILNLKKTRNYQLACAKHFEVTHPNAASHRDVSLDGVGNHPNAWFAASVAYRAKMKKQQTRDEGEESTQVTPEKNSASPAEAVVS